MLKIKVASCDKLQYFSFAPLQNFCYIGLNIEEGNITRINVSMRKIYYTENFERLGDIYIYIAGVESVSENLGRWKASGWNTLKERRLDDRKQQGVKTSLWISLCAFGVR